MIKIYRYSKDYVNDWQRGKISHVVLSVGKRWISFDRSGVMGWNGHKNFYWIFTARSNRAF